MADELTGLPICRDLATSSLDGSAFAVFVDIDGFIWFNDGHGHVAGDRTLIVIANAIARRAATVARATTYRVGGDEFLVVLPDSGLDAALELARAIVEDVRALRIPYARRDRPTRTTLEVNAVAMRLTAAAFPPNFASHGFTDEFQHRAWTAVDAKKRETGSQAGVVAAFDVLSVRVMSWPIVHCLFIFPDEGDPHAHDAWPQIKDDLINKAKLTYLESTGVLAFAKFIDTFRSDLGEIQLIHEADPGDFSITATSAEALAQIIDCFTRLPNYTVEFVASTSY